MIFRSKYSGKALYESEHDDLIKALEEAVEKKRFLRAVNLKEAVLDGANLQEGKFAKANFKDASLKNANLSWAVFDRANLKRVDFTGANLSHCSFVGANLEGAILCNTNLEGADFGWTCMEWVDIENATIKDTNFKNANIGGIVGWCGDLPIAEKERRFYQHGISKVTKLGQFDKLEKEFKDKENGWQGLPLVVHQERLLCGVTRYNAAKRNGWSNNDIPVIELEELFR